MNEKTQVRDVLPFRENLEQKLGGAFPLSVMVTDFRSEGTEVPEHWHPYVELEYVLNGTARIALDGTEFTIKPADAVLIPAGKVHAVVPCRKDCQIGVILVDYHEPLPGCFLPAAVSEKAGSIFLTMLRESREQHEGWKFIVKGLLYELLGQLQRSGTPIRFEHNYSGEGQALEDYIRTNLTGDLSLQTVATYAGYSPTYFSRRFVTLMGMPLKQYVDQMRVHAACRMLMEGMSASAAASALNFSELPSFCRTFKRITGLSPSEYREKAKNEQE